MSSVRLAFRVCLVAYLTVAASSSRAQTVAEPEVAALAGEPPTAAGVESLNTATQLLIRNAAEDALKQVETPSLQLYGFADFGATAVVHDGTRAIEGFFGQSPSFSVGNLNLYLSADLTANFKSLAEVRLTYLPNGSADLATGVRQSTLASDQTVFGQATPWGGIVLERVWIEYQLHTLLTIRAGQWLTPVGIWNVDHGSPTIIPALRPYVISAGMFPIRQTGFELYGTQPLGDALTLRYHLTLSNGRGNADSYLDFDHNKALGARVTLTLRGLGNLTVGASGFMGRSTDSYRIRATLDNGNAGLAPEIASQYDELSYAADLLWRYQDLHVQVEAFGNQGVYAMNHRPRAALQDGNGLVPDFNRWGGYALVAYQLPWLTLMPFLNLEYVADGNAATGGPASSGRIFGISGGLNVRPAPTVVLKAQFSHGTVKNAGRHTESFDNIAATIAWSF